MNKTSASLLIITSFVLGYIAGHGNGVQEGLDEAQKQCSTGFYTRNNASYGCTKMPYLTPQELQSLKHQDRNKP